MTESSNPFNMLCVYSIINIGVLSLIIGGHNMNDHLVSNVV